MLVLDLWTKQAVFEHLGVDAAEMTSVSPARYVEDVLVQGERVKIKLIPLLNPGMMWGALQDYPTILKIVRPLAVIVIFMLLSSVPADQWPSRLALGGILGGAIGNIHDSFRYFGVRDFFQVKLTGVPLFEPFPSFNVADSAICVGVAVLAIGMMRGSRSEEPAPAVETTAPKS